MSDKPISVGDLVQVVKPAACGCTTAVGITRTVTAFRQSKGKCAQCGVHRDLRLTAVLDGDAPWSHWHITPDRLKRIPPLDELEGQRTEENLKVPA